MPYTEVFVSAQESTNETLVETEAIEPDTIIDTGTAVAASESYTVDNINDVETDIPNDIEQATTTNESIDSFEETSDQNQTAEDELTSSTTIPSTEAATSTEAISAQLIASSSPDAVIEIANESTASTSATTTAESGSNIATSPETTAIFTGDAYAYSNVVNLTNTNLINSTGFIIFLNQLFGMNGADVRELFDIFSDSATTSPCNESNCEARQLEYYIDNQAAIDNTITVSANSGNNSASGTNAAIVTGNAYAAANVTNIANTNIVDANYMLLTFSNFGDLLGDIVLPGKQLLEKLFQTIGGGTNLTTITGDSQANIQNNISTNANTGDNNSTGTSSTILTGEATTYNNVHNQVNTNVINNDSFTMLFRVAGDWDGEIYGLPDGLTWERTSSGISITNTPSIGETAVSTPAVSADVTSVANINNNVSVSASTGNNQVNSSEQGYIQTGNAYAASNVTNIANTNILGRNWSLLIFDIFGDWQGNISFGQPDLWIGGTANAQRGIIGAGQEVTYTFTISNLGDAKATNVTLNGNFSNELMSLVEPIENIHIGTIAPGEMIEKTFTAKVTDTLADGSFPVDLTAELSSTEPDDNLENNTEVVTVLAEYHRGSGSRSGFTANDIRPVGDLSITKTANKDSIGSGEVVSYEISITNSGGPVYGATLYDTLFDPAGEVIANKQWDLETIDPEETVIITYDTEYTNVSTAGTYLNRAQVLGYHKNRISKYMSTYDSKVATHALLVTGATPLVLGIATSTENCDPYLTSFLKINKDNDENQVERLQTFFNDFTTYQVPINSTFDTATEKAVREFQEEYASDILEPWGLKNSSGYVYYTTKKKINELYCDETKTFPLTTSELTEINRFKFAGVTNINNSTNPTTAETNTQTILVSSVTKKDSAEPAIKPSIVNVEIETESMQENRSLFTRAIQWIKNPSFSNLKFWNRLLASQK